MATWRSAFSAALLLAVGTGALADVTTIDRVRASGDIVVADDGTIYLADSGSPNLGNGNSVVRIRPDGSQDTLVSGIGRALAGVALDSQGNLIQASFNSGEVFRIDLAGNAALIANVAQPVGVAVDADDVIYVTQCGAGAIAQIDATGVVTQIARDPLLNCPNGMVLGHDGALYVVNFSDGQMLRVGLAGEVSNFATIPGGGNGHVEFSNGAYYVAARVAHRIYQVSTTGEVTAFAGTGVDGETDGSNLAATLSRPNGIGVDPNGQSLYVVGSSNFQAADLPVRRIDLPAGEGFVINAGLAGAWFNAETSGQGFLVDVIPDTGQLVLAWFTYGTTPATDSALVGSAGHEWFTAQGPTTGNRADLVVTQTTGGVFDDPAPVTNASAGTLTLVFHDCGRATLTYTLADGRSGEIELTRLTSTEVCEELVAAPADQKRNLPPQILNLVARVDGDLIRVDFDLTDPENDSLEISAAAVSESGLRVEISPAYLTGDAGFPVPAASSRSLTWSYRQDPAFETLGSEVLRIELTADDRFVAGLQDIVNLVSETRLIGDVERMQGVRHFRSSNGQLEATRELLRAEMSANGLNVRDQTFTWQGDVGFNVIGSLTGSAGADAYYIVDGHYDTVLSTPGADDNASGTAGMLEVMRVLSQFNVERSVRFIGFDKEELGLLGSQFYARRVPQTETILGMINFEMIGYTCSGQPECVGNQLADTSIYNIHPAFSSQLANSFASLAAVHVPALKVSTFEDDGDPNLRRSDHAPFWDIGVDALFLTDGANFRTPHYHQASDLIGTMDTAFMANVVRASVATIAQAVGASHSDSASSDLLQP